VNAVLLITILWMSFSQSPTQENKPAVLSGSPVGLTFDEFKKVYPLARCFFADDKKADTLEFCIVEPPNKDTRVLLFDRFLVTREIVTFSDQKVKQVAATLSEKSMVVRKYLDEIVPKSDSIHECMERAQRKAEYEADFHTRGLSQPDKDHYWDEIRQATLAVEANGCGSTPTGTLTTWEYHGERIEVKYEDENITEMKITAI
jgi:hypothetical protein